MVFEFDIQYNRKRGVLFICEGKENNKENGSLDRYSQHRKVQINYDVVLGRMQ